MERLNMSFEKIEKEPLTDNLIQQDIINGFRNKIKKI